ncbi:hypothetical protein ES702_01893 [subsurface metagenome]
MISPSHEIRAVLDTNIFVAAFKKPGGLASRIVKDDWALNRYTLLTSMSIITEVVTVLSAARVPKKSIQGLVSLIMLYAQVQDEHRIQRTIKKHKQDDIFIACALAGNADYIVTLNKKHFSRPTYNGVKVVTPFEFRQIISRP